MANYDVAIIGGGVTGFGAAMYSGRFQLKTVVYSDTRGGTLILTDDVANYPGFNQISGFDLAKKIEEHALEYGVEVKDEKADRIEKQKDGTFKITSSTGSIIAKTIIFATGTEWRKLNVPGETEFTSKGVHYCALCDGGFYKGKRMAVVGGSDSAAKEALLLAGYAKELFIFVRGDKMRAEPINAKRLAATKNVKIFYKTQIKEIKGEKKITHVILDKPIDGKHEFALDAVFVEIGHIPLSQLAKDAGIALNDKGEIIIDRDCRTNVPGFFAAGDVVDTKFKQAITGVAEGVIASYSAYQHITKSSL
jgi:thioredoxin reductase (NADPH)